MKISRTLLEGCQRCSLRGEAPPVQPPTEVKSPKLCVVTRRATTEDALFNVPVYDSAGQQLRSAVMVAGWPRDEVYYTSAVKCAPKEKPPQKPKCPADCRHECMNTWLKAELSELPLGTPVVFVGRQTAGEVVSFCGEALGYRPLYVIDSEASLMTGGSGAYERAVEFFVRLRRTQKQEIGD